jgi:hypothetical protein
MRTLFPLLALALAGCTSFSSVQIRHPDGTIESRQRVRSFWDSKSDLQKLRVTQTGTNSQTLSLAGLAESTSSTNTVELLHAVADVLKSIPAK